MKAVNGSSIVPSTRAREAIAELARIRALCPEGVEPVDYIKHMERQLDDILTERQQYAFDRPPVHAQ